MNNVTHYFCQSCGYSFDVSNYERHCDVFHGGNRISVVPRTPKKGVELIADERRKQISVFGFTKEHDAQHDPSMFAKAAQAYLMPTKHPEVDYYHSPPSVWPWEKSWWKHEGRVRSLVKAGALTAAAIDRINGVSGA